MFKLRWVVVLLLAVPLSAQKIFIYPKTVSAPRGSYQTVTAIVTGVNDKTVTWTSSGGRLVGSNPCLVNEPCTIGLFSDAAGKFTLKATSDANHSLSAASEITFTASPKPLTTSPHLVMTADMLPELRSKATSKNVLYQTLKAKALNDLQHDSDIWSWSCKGGSGQPKTDQSPNAKEVDSYLFAIMSEVAPTKQERDQFGCAGHDVFMTNVGYVLAGKFSLSGGNRWSDSATEWAFTPDLLMGGGYLSPSDQVTVRQYFAKFAYEQLNSKIGSPAVIGNYNSSAQFSEQDDFSASNMRALGNNYTQARILILTGASLTFNDNPTDDPPLKNTCNATRYQVCPDGSAGSLHAYWAYLTGGVFYRFWGNLEEPSVVRQAYNAAYKNMPSQPMCNAAWHKPVLCLGGGRGGESSEGFIYGGSLAATRRAINAIHNAGYDDPLLYGPQMSLVTTSYWDLRYLADLTGLTGLSGVSDEQSRWNFVTDGDSNYYFAYPANFATESALLYSDSLTGRTDRADALRWLVTNTAYGTATGKVGKCKFYCGFISELGNDFGSSVLLDMFLALPAGDPVTNNPPADPRPALPTDWYAAGNQHIVTRDGWGTDTSTIFSYYCTNTQIDHEHQFCGGFDLYSKGEYITKGRMEFNNYNDERSLARNKNTLALVQSPGQTRCPPNGCTYWEAVNYGGQFWHGYQGGLVTLNHSELPGYVAAIADDMNAYNGGWGGYATYFSGITGASRSLIYLKDSREVVYYDRGATGDHAWDKATYLVATGAPTFNGNTASWRTRSGRQRAYWIALEPAEKAPQLDLAYNDPDVANDWEIYGRLKIDAGDVASAHFLSVLEWGPADFSASPASTVRSSSGTPFEGALVGPSLVMFMRDLPGTFTSVTYPASGAKTQYVSDLTPNTAYSISAAGAPSNVTTDTAGVLVFPTTGSGNITIGTQR